MGRYGKNSSVLAYFRSSSCVLVIWPFVFQFHCFVFTIYCFKHNGLIVKTIMGDEGVKDMSMNGADGVIGATNTPEPDVTPYRMPAYLIAVICLSIVLGIVMVCKIFKHIRTKQIRLPCCVEGPKGNSSLQRRDTFKPLIRSGSTTSDGGSTYDRQRGGRGGPDMV